MNFNETDEFTKDVKRLSKKYTSLPNDLLEFKKVVSKFPLAQASILRHFTFKELLPLLKLAYFVDI